MAEKVQIQVELASKLKSTENIVSKMREKEGFKKNPGAESRIKEIVQELESLNKISNPTAKNLSRIDALFNQLSEILLKVAKTISTTSKEFDDLTKHLDQLQAEEEKLKKERSGILKQGRVNKDTKKYELFNTYQNEVVANAQIKNARGTQIKKADTFLSKFDSSGQPVADAFLNPDAAKQVYDALLKAQTDNAARLEAINTSLESYKTQIDETTNKLQSIPSGDESFSADIISNKVGINRAVDSSKEVLHEAENQNQLTSSIEGATSALTKQDSALGRAFKQFTIYNFAVKSVKKALSEAVKTITELDQYLTEQAMVTGLTRQETYALIDSYQKLAIQSGATTKEIASVATEYMKQGKTIEDSLVLTEAAVKAAKVARVSVGDSVNYLTTALNGFRLETEDAMKVSDKFAAVAASSATDYDELAIALSKVASQANLAGMSIDYTTALLTKGLETTREAPETMGTALKTIIARMRELGDYGETLDDGMDINNVESQLKYVGIALRDSNGELRSTEDVLDELGKKWDTLNKNQQAAIAKALAGTRQQSRLIAMMEDYERVTELQEISQRSAGATAAQAATYLEGMEAALNNIQVAWEKIVMTLSDSDFIIGVFTAVGKTLDKIGDQLKTTGGQIKIYGALGAIMAGIAGHKLRELNLNKEIEKVELRRQIIEKQRQIEEANKTIKNEENKIKEKIQPKIDNAQKELDLAIKQKENDEEAITIEKQKEQNLLSAEKNVLKWEEIDAQNELHTAELKTKATCENAYATEQEMFAQEQLETAEKYKQLQIEKEKYKTLLEEKQLNGEELTAEEQQDLSSLDGEIEKYKILEEEAFKQAALSQKRAQASRDAADEAKKELEIQQEKTKKDKTTLKGMKTKSENAKKQYDLAKKEAEAARGRLKTADADIKNKKNALALAEKEKETALANGNANIQAAKENISIYQQQLALLQQQQGGLSSIFGWWNDIKGLMLLFKPIYLGAIGLQKLLNKLKTDEVHIERRKQAQEAKGLKNKFISALYSMADSAASIPVAGWIAAAAILALAGITIAVGIANAKQQEYNKSAEGTAEKVNKLSNEIYKLNEQSVAIDNITNSFDKLDNKIIKTKEDVAEMSELLAQAGEQMNNDEVDDKKNEGFGKGVNEKEHYESLSDEGKRKYLEDKQAQIDAELRDKRQDQVDLINNMSSSERDKFLDENTTNNEIRAAQDAIYELNKQTVYDTIDALKDQNAITNEVAAATENLTRSMLDNLSVKDSWDFVNDPNKIKELTEAIAELETEAINLDGKTVNISIAEVLESDDYSLKDKTEAYQEMIQNLQSMGDEYAEVIAAFKEEYQGLEKFAEYKKQYGSELLNFIEDAGLSNDDINALYGAWEDLRKAGVQITQEEWQDNFGDYLNTLAATQGDVVAATKQVFGEYLDGTEKTMNAFISAYGDLVQVGILNMGQNMDKVRNSINNFYEKALEWNKMSESDKAEFIQDNAELFADDLSTEENEGQILLKAFESGDYSAIEEALKNNKALRDQIDQRKKEIAQELKIEEARTGEDRNEAYISQLKKYEAYLNNVEDLFKASLEVRLEQEENQLDEYKSYLEDQREALEESLEKRKEAYEKYFDAINENEEDEEYEEEAEKLVSNLSKLGSSTSATSEQKAQEIEQKLEELEEERLKELRERSQEAILEKMDDDLEEISKKFDDLLENNRALLAAMQGELDNPVEYIGKLLTNKADSGASALEIESYIQTLQGTYGSVLGNRVDWDNINVREENNQVILNVHGKEIILNSTDEQNLYETIMTALTAIGGN